MIGFVNSYCLKANGKWLIPYIVFIYEASSICREKFHLEAFKMCIELGRMKFLSI